ncbi:MAG TPA: hypothetical protein VGJ66_03090 [Pyrinomonadaceae bacterium]|jgi:hypothetical protein
MPHSKAKRHSVRIVLEITFASILLLLFVALPSPRTQAGDAEYVGSLDGQLVPNTDGLEQIVFRPLRDWIFLVISKVVLEQ